MQITIVTVLRHYYSFVKVVITIDNFGETAFGFIESKDLRIDLGFVVNFNSEETGLLVNCQIDIFVEVLVFVSVLF